MRPHWECATLVLETLAMKVGPLDENGLDLLFTIGCDHYKKENVKGFDIPATFRAAMKAAQAPDDKSLYQTSMAQSLDSILSAYGKDMSKKLTIIILTTGEWEGRRDDAENVIADAFKAMCKVKSNFERERLCTIEFVAFGDNAEALGRLRDLDDKMERFGIP